MEGLRERINVPLATVEERSATSSGLETPVDEEEELDKEQKTFGRTPDGTSKSRLHDTQTACTGVRASNAHVSF